MPKIVERDPIIVYSVKELSLLFPDSFKKAHDRFRESEDMHYQLREGMDSFKALCRVLELKIYDYSLSLFYGGNFVEVSSLYDVQDLKGLRAYKYIVNRLDDYESYPWHPLSKHNFKEFEVRKQSWGKPWKRRDCPLTGVYYDDELINFLKYKVLKGYTIGSALHYALCHLRTLLESEYDEITNESSFIEYCENNEIEFLESGRIF